MSIFPAYSEVIENDPEEVASPVSDKNGEEKHWLENSSFVPAPDPEIEVTIEPENILSSSESLGETSKDLKKRRKEKKKKKKKEKKPKISGMPAPVEFSGNEDYYVDKKSLIGYLNVDTLHKPACPRYYSSHRILGNFRRVSNKYSKRYYKNRLEKEDALDFVQPQHPLSEEDYSNKTKDFNRKFLQSSKDVEVWIEFVQHQDRAPIKITKTQLAERKMDILDKALIHNFGDDKLYKLYVSIIDATFPSFEVSKILEKLLSKDPTNYILWAAQIFATQGSMARCVVPDVLKLYEKCMQKMYRKCQQDEIMLSPDGTFINRIWQSFCEGYSTDLIPLAMWEIEPVRKKGVLPITDL